MKQSLKIISAVSALAAISAIIGGCSSEPKEPYSTAPLSEIREQGASLPEFANLNLSETAIYIPVVDNVRGFSFLTEELTAAQREEKLLKAADLFSGEQAETLGIEYLTKTGETLSYNEISGDEKNDCYFVKYKGSGCDLGINIGGNYMYARKSEIPKTAKVDTDDYWIEFGTRRETYNLRNEIPDTSVELTDGAESISDILLNMLDILQCDMPYFASEQLTLKPNTAEIYKVGDKNGINIGFYYEYDGVPIDSYFRGSYMNLNDDGRNTRTSISCEASSVWVNSVDELYSARNYVIEPGSEVFGSFIDLNSALEIVSEKLTAASVFKVEYIEFAYGLNRIMPDDFYENASAKAFEYEPVKIEATPVWIVNIPATGIAETPYLRIIVDAVSGEIEILQ